MSIGMRLGAALVLALAIGFTACQLGPSAESRSTPPLALEESGLALDSENNLVEFDLRTGNLVKKQRLAPRPAAPSNAIPGHRLALSPDAASVYALIPMSEQSSAVVAVARQTLAMRWMSPLPAGAGQPRAVVVGPRSGSVFALTNYTVGPGIQGFGPRPEVVVSQLDPVRGTLTSSKVLRRPDLASRAPEDWFVLQGVIDPGEITIYLSFHNQGLFAYDLSQPGFAPRCPGSTCLSGHGDAAMWESSSIITATGSRHVDLITPDGALQRSFDTQLDRNHLMTFALDPARKLLYAVGSCKYVPGMTVVDLTSGDSRAIVPERASSIP